MSELYCLRCKSHTKTSDMQVSSISTHYKKGPRAGQTIERPAVIGVCDSCGSRKVKFVKSAKDGEGLLGSLLGLPGGQVPLLGQLPLIGGLF